MKDRLLTPEEAAAILSVSPKSIRAWLRSRKLKGFKAGRLWRVREDDLKAFLTDLEEESGDLVDEEERSKDWLHLTREERIQRIMSMQARYADLDISTEKFIRHKQEEIDREEIRQRERHSA